MKTYWQTLAIVNAIWAASGDVDLMTVIQVVFVVWCLGKVHLMEKAERIWAEKVARSTATAPDTLT